MLSRSLKHTAVLIACGLVHQSWSPVAAQLTFEGAVYHEATRNGYGIGTQDAGGALFMFVRNNTGTTQTFTNGTVSINGQAASSQSNYDWSRVWPISVAPGELATLTLKGNGGVLSPNQTVNVSLSTDSNVKLTQNNISLSTPKLRVANVVPSQDLTRSYVYLRNDDTSPYDINSLFMNDEVMSTSRFVGGTSIAPNSVKIIEVDFGQPQELLTAYAVRVQATRAIDSQSVLTGAPVRLTEPILPTSSWQADLATNEGVMRDARLDYGHDIHGATSRFPDTMETRLGKFSIRGLHIDVLDFPNGDLSTVEYRDFTTGVEGGVPYQAPLFQLPAPVADRADDDAIYGWYVRDEPDLQQNSSTRNPQAMWRLNDTYWRNSPKPTFLNMVKDNQIQRYGLISDHPAIDRYMQEAPLSDSAGNRNIDQVLQYADSLKSNVEPLRMWWVTQGISDAWGGDQPTDWGIDVQFWSAIMGGAKGMVGFMFDHREQSHPAQFARQVEVVHELQTVRNLVLYGETIDNTTLSVGGNVVDQSATDITAAARSIISEDAVVLPVANLTGRTSGVFGGSPTFDVLQDVTVEVTIPEWINIAQVKRLTQNGYVDLSGDFSYTQDGQQISIMLDSLVDTDVFLISEEDLIAPGQVQNLRIVDNNYLSWEEPFDNFGVHKYQVFQDGNLLAEVPTPGFELGSYNPGSEYRVKAIDASGNAGALSSLLQSIWNGNDPSAGTPGNGTGWSDANNWSRGGVFDTNFVTGDSVAFAPGSSQTNINLEGNRVVGSLDFQASYNLIGNNLTINSGEIAVQSNSTARITSSIILPTGTLTKAGSGILIYNGAIPSVVVVEGTYKGNSTPATIEVKGGATLSPGDPVGIMSIAHQLILRPDSTLEINVCSSGSNSNVIASFSGQMFLSGTLRVSLIDQGSGAYQPVGGDVFLVARSFGTLTGVFEDYELPSLTAGLNWDVIYDTPQKRVLLQVISTGDYNGDGTVNSADYTVWRNSLGQTGTGLPADGTGDGVVDGNDYSFWKSNFGNTVDYLTEGVQSFKVLSTVPEPNTAFLPVVVGIFFLGRFNRRSL